MMNDIVSEPLLATVSVAWLTLLLRHIAGGTLVVCLMLLLLLLAGRRGTASAFHRRLAAGWGLLGERNKEKIT